MAGSILLYGLAGQEKEKAEKGFPHQSGSYPVGDGFLATVTK